MKQLFCTLILFSFMAVAGLSDIGSKHAIASTDVNVVVSSSMQSRVFLSSGIAIRIDNWNNGTQCTGSGCLLSNRVAVCFDNQDSGNSLWWGHDSSVSTNTASGDLGHELKAGDYLCIALIRGAAIHASPANAAGAAGVILSVTQYAKE